MKNNKKELSSILLSESPNHLEKLNSLIEVNKVAVWSEIFNILFEVVYNGPLEDASLILDNIEKVILNSDKEDSKRLISIIGNTIYKFSSLKVNENNTLKNIKFRLLDIIRKLREEKTKEDNTNLYNLYYKIIFEERDLSVIEMLLKEEKNIFNRKDKNGKDLFYNILTYYSSLEESNTNEINYFSDVIMLFIKIGENNLVKRWKEYSKVLEEETVREKQHVKEIKRKLYGVNDIDILELKKKYDIHSKVHDDVLKELSTFNFDEKKRVRINHNFITIDGEESSCLDDALCLVKNRDGSYTFYIAISDIPALIPYGSRTFYDAMRRNETLYLCDDMIDLYHPLISHDLCSLLPEKDKCAIVYKYFVDPNFNLDIDSLEIIKGTIRVGNRLTYSNVNKGFGITREEAQMIENMYLLVSTLKNKNKQKEKYRKVENMLYSNAIYHHSLFADKSVSANIIQESMLLVNSSVPRYFSKNNFIYTYRNHHLPSDKEMNKKIDYLLQMNREDLADDKYKEILKSIKEMYLNAHYSTENLGHEGLGYDFYSHSTSPARRFDDSFNEYLTYFQVFNKIESDLSYYELEALSREVVEHINKRKSENNKFASQYNYLRSKVRILEKK